jgi:hypothetical protein
LAKVQWTFTIGESHIGKNLIGEIPEPQNFKLLIEIYSLHIQVKAFSDIQLQIRT